jgi:hypothetical protein
VSRAAASDADIVANSLRIANQLKTVGRFHSS